MNRVLLVDDEPRVLSALKRVLHGRRHRWDMMFVEGGKAGLLALEHGPFDILLTDMRMPDVDGCMLIAAARARWPDIVCIMLSGYMDKPTCAVPTDVADFHLAKPCTPEAIDEALAQAHQRWSARRL